jgi:hypothetical protein
MTAEDRLTLMKSLVLWSLNSSDAVQAMIKESYKQTRRDDDKNQPRSVQPWFSDSYRRRYWLIEGLEDSYFRVYRENDGKTAKSNQWFNVAGTIDEVNALADKFASEATTNAKIHCDKLRSAIPRFEAGEEKRRRRDYRLARKAAFTRPEPGFSLYEGRTRGKRMKYTYSDGEEDSDVTSRRSTRNATPLENGPTTTLSGRTVKSRLGGVYGESLLTDQRKEMEAFADEVNGGEAEDSEDMPTTTPAGRPMRGARMKKSPTMTRECYESESDEWSGNEDESDKDSEPEFEAEADDDDEEMSDEGLEADEIQDEGDTQESLVVQLRYRKGNRANGERDRTSLHEQVNGNGVDYGGEAAKGFRPLAPAPPRAMEQAQPLQTPQSIGPNPIGVSVQQDTVAANSAQHVSPGHTLLNGKSVSHGTQPQQQAMDVS